jgi:hypothetical protein
MGSKTLQTFNINSLEYYSVLHMYCKTLLFSHLCNDMGLTVTELAQ